MNVAIIPARGGSKRVPRKNIRPFAGKPMIAWAIEAARESGCFDRIVVSTDDDEVAMVAEALGAEVPFRRPAELANDTAATRPVVNHAIGEITRLYGKPEFTCCIYATSPFLSPDDLKAALGILQSGQIDFVFSAGSFAYPIQRAFRLLPEGGVERLWPEHRLTRSQDLEEAYHDAGQFYWGRTDSFLANRDTVSASSRAFVLPRHRVHDIDTEEDWTHAELTFKALRGSRV